MAKEKKLLYIIKFVLSAVLFCGAVYFENAQQVRLLTLAALFVLFSAGGLIRVLLEDRAGRYIFMSYYLDIALVFLMEQNSRLLINYFFHSLYIIVLLEAAFSLNLRKGLAVGGAVLIVSMTKYGFLIYYKFDLASVSQMAFFLLVNALILVIAGFAQYNREERQKKDTLYKELLDTHRQLKQYADEVNRLSVVEERNRIARDIHDTLGHNMTALIMQLQMAEHLYGEDSIRSAELLAGAAATAKDSLTGIREVVETLRGNEAQGCSEDAIRRLTDDFSERTGASIQLEILESGGNGSAAAIALYRIVQEALTNAVRHGNAGVIAVKIEYLPREIRFQIHDNGKGNPEWQEGFGLRRIRERAEAFGGSVSFQSSESGFSVCGRMNLED
jgi:Signal transduction histidine kinase